MAQRNFIVRGRNTRFTCVHCGAVANPHPSSVRNHCPACLWSRHVDAEVPGDRAATCKAPMEPIGTCVTRTGYDIEYRCTSCGKIGRNTSAPDDSIEALTRLPGVTSGPAR
ncbi:MAG: RNHCP domain-containing protein [Candidatus Andersenbacteria bacterium]